MRCGFVSMVFKVEKIEALFHAQLGDESVNWIPPWDLERFSPCVPGHPISASHGQGIIDSCWELNSTSTPMYLIN